MFPLPFKLPTTATAPFCPSEVAATVEVPEGDPFWKKVVLSTLSERGLALIPAMIGVLTLGILTK